MRTSVSIFTDCPIPGCDCRPIQSLICAACGKRGVIRIDEEKTHCQECGAVTDLYEVLKATEEANR